MKKIDWQAYLDGSLNAEERHQAEELLKSDPVAQKELDGLKEFCQIIKEQGLSEAVPTDRLANHLSTMVKDNRAPWFARPAVLVPTAVAACALTAIALFSPPPVTQRPEQVATTQTHNDEYYTNLELSPFQASTAVDDPQEAATWAATMLNRPAPVITLAGTPGATLDQAECGYCWIAYKFTYEGEHYTIYGRKEQDRFSDLQGQACGEKTLYVFPNAVGWRCAEDMDYVIKGGTPEGRRLLAEAASQETSNLVGVSL